MKDPRGLYPTPPFKAQSQPFPGLESKVDPLPDYGRETYRGTGKLEGKVAVITGGDSGIGRATAYAFALEGAKVAISFLPEEESDAKQLKADLKKRNCTVLLIPGDIRKEEQCKTIVEKTVAEYGSLDVVVNNAAYQKTLHGINDITEEVLRRTYETNIFAPILLIKAAWDHLKPGSTIINTVSIQAYNPSSAILIYASSKAALVNMTKSLAKWGAEKGVRVNAVAPGPIWSPLNTVDPAPGHVENFGSGVLLKRPGQPIEVAHVFVFLASDNASYVTGHIYGVTGGGVMGL